MLISGPTTTDVAQVGAAGATGLLAILTFLYVKATRHMVTELREARIAQQRPYVVLDFENPRYSLCDMVIKNIGNGAALDVTVDFDPDPPYRDGAMRLSKLPLFRQLKFFAPSREFRFFYKNMVGDGSGPGSPDATILATVRYSDTTGNRYEDVIPLNPYVRWHLSQLQEKDMNDLVKAAEAMSKQLSEIAKEVREFKDSSRRESRAALSEVRNTSLADLEARMIEVRQFWLTIQGSESEHSIYHSHSDFQARLYRMATGILTLAAALRAKDRLSDSRLEIARRISALLLDLGVMMFFLDEEDSDNEFTAKGRELLDLIAEFELVVTAP